MKFLPHSFSAAARITTFVLLAVVFSSVWLHAQGPQEAEARNLAQIRFLNNSVLKTHQDMQQAGPNDVTVIRKNAAIGIARRAAALQRLIQSNPRAALTFAFSQELLSDMAEKFPRAVNLLESHITVQGSVEHWIADSSDGTARSSYRMKSGDHYLNLHFAAAPPVLKDFESLHVTGVVAGNEVAVENSYVISKNSTSASTGSVQREGLGFSVLLLGMMLLPVSAKTALRRTLTRLCSLEYRKIVAAVLLTLLVVRPSFAQSSPCSTKGIQKTAVLVVTIPNGPMPTNVSVSTLEDVFFAKNTPGLSVDGFIKEASYGQASVTGDVLGPYDLTGTYSSCMDVGGVMLNDAVAAAIHSGVNLNNYNRLFLVFPDIWGCGWTGFAEVGSCSLATTSGTFNLSISEISAAYTSPRSSGVYLTSHELGHNLGLLHSGKIMPAAPTDALGPLDSPGTQDDLNDWWSAMGSNVLGLYPAAQKAEVLNWMAPTTNYQVIQSSGNFTLQPLENGSTGLQALKVQRGTGSNQWLWVEYRQPSGSYDSTLLPQPFSGAIIHYQDAATQIGHTYLANFNPSDTSWMSPAIVAGQTWVDPYSNLSISVIGASSAGLSISVNYGATLCSHANPTVSMGPLDPTTTPGSEATYTVTVKNNDSASCSSSTFTATSVQPLGWSASLSPATISLGPGQSGSVTMKQVPSLGTAPGTYAIAAAAANLTYASSANGNLTVITPPSAKVSLTASASTYTRRSSIGLSATVMNGGVPVAGASTTFSMTLSNGSVVKQTATTNRKGVASWSYKLGQQSPTGTYSASAQVSLNSQITVSNTVSFTVQ